MINVRDVIYFVVAFSLLFAIVLTVNYSVKNELENNFYSTGIYREIENHNDELALELLFSAREDQKYNENFQIDVSFYIGTILKNGGKTNEALPYFLEVVESNTWTIGQMLGLLIDNNTLKEHSSLCLAEIYQELGDINMSKKYINIAENYLDQQSFGCGTMMLMKMDRINNIKITNAFLEEDIESYLTLLNDRLFSNDSTSLETNRLIEIMQRKISKKLLKKELEKSIDIIEENKYYDDDQFEYREYKTKLFGTELIVTNTNLLVTSLDDSYDKIDLDLARKHVINSYFYQRLMNE